MLFVMLRRLNTTGYPFVFHIQVFDVMPSSEAGRTWTPSRNDTKYRLFINSVFVIVHNGALRGHQVCNLESSMLLHGWSYR
jgi:hypothetical protein